MMCSVCEVREQRDDDEFMPCSPYCLNAWTLWHAEQMRAACIAAVEALPVSTMISVGFDETEMLHIPRADLIAALREVQP